MSVTQQLDSSGALGRTLAALMLGLAEMEREAIRERQAAGIARLIRETAAVFDRLQNQTRVGRMHARGRAGAKRYGAHPREQPIVNLIMDLRRQRGWGVRRNAAELNRRGIVNRVGSRWVPTAIQRILDRHE